MTDTELVASLELENIRLKEDNESLLKVIAQMKVTINRMIDRYISVSNN